MLRLMPAARLRGHRSAAWLVDPRGPLLACALACVLASTPLGRAHAAAGARERPADALPELPVPGSGERVLVIAPHPDDETLCCGGLLQRAASAGASVGVVWITAGDSFEIDAMVTERTLRPKGRGLAQLGAQRIAEAHAAADLLGVPRENQFVLGYPDRGLAALLAGSGTRVHRSAYTHTEAVTYDQALSPGSAYTGDDLRRDLDAVLTRFAPTIVLVAAPQDRHSDHRASGALTMELLATKLPRARAYYWIVHAGLKWPWPHGLHRTRSLRPPARAALLDWQTLPLDDFTEERKLLALRQHGSQLRVMSWFLESFVRSNELFAPVPVSAPVP